jgi:hypothetical protein
MSQNLNNVTAFDGTNYGYWKAHMRFLLKSIDCWKIVEISWTKPADATLNQSLIKTHDYSMIKPSMLYVKRFHRLNLLESQTVNPLKKYDKS